MSKYYVLKHKKSGKYISPAIYTAVKDIECPMLTNDLQTAEAVHESFLNSFLGTCNLFDVENDKFYKLCERTDFEVLQVKRVIIKS